MAKLFKQDGTVEEVKPKDGKKFAFKEVQKLVDGTVEVVPWMYTPVGHYLLVNEDGSITKKPNANASKEFQLPLWGDVLLLRKTEIDL